MKSNIKYMRFLVFGAVFIALGILIPQLFHTAGAGKIFLPMHFSVLLGGFVLGPMGGIAVGAVTPVLSHLFIGMPPMAPVPIMLYMVFELASYGGLTGVFYRKLKLNMYVSLVLAMLGGRIVYAVAVFTLNPVFGMKIAALPMVAGAVVDGAIGIALQIAVVPALLFALKKAGLDYYKGK